MRFAFLAAFAVALFMVSVVLHNLVSGLLGIEEPVFFLLAVVVAPLLFVAGVAGGVVAIIRRRIGR